MSREEAQDQQHKGADPRDKDPWNDEALPEPTRAPTTQEKISVLLPALLAFGGMILMLLIFLAVALWRS